jgi:hypothetical protein
VAATGGGAVIHACKEYRVLDVKNGLDVVIGRQCSVCLRVLCGVGTCHGCGKKDRDLRLRAGELLYCNDVCRKNELKAAREKRNAALYANNQKAARK